MRSVPTSCAVPNYPSGLGHFPDRQLVLFGVRCSRLMWQARISLNFLPLAYWMKICTLFVLSQCINSVLQKVGRGSAFKARGMQLMRKWKQNSESWQHKEQDKIRKQSGWLLGVQECLSLGEISWNVPTFIQAPSKALLRHSICHPTSASTHIKRTEPLFPPLLSQKQP